MRTSFRHQSEAQPPNGPLTAAASPDTPSYMASQAVRSPRVVIRAAPEVQTSSNDLSLHHVGPPDP